MYSATPPEKLMASSGPLYLRGGVRSSVEPPAHADPWTGSSGRAASPIRPSTGSGRAGLQEPARPEPVEEPALSLPKGRERESPGPVRHNAPTSSSAI